MSRDYYVIILEPLRSHVVLTLAYICDRLIGPPIMITLDHPIDNKPTLLRGKVVGFKLQFFLPMIGIKLWQLWRMVRGGTKDEDEGMGRRRRRSRVND